MVMEGNLTLAGEPNAICRWGIIELYMKNFIGSLQWWEMSRLTEASTVLSTRDPHSDIACLIIFFCWITNSTWPVSLLGRNWWGRASWGNRKERRNIISMTAGMGLGAEILSGNLGHVWDKWKKYQWYSYLFGMDIIKIN